MKPLTPEQLAPYPIGKNGIKFKLNDDYYKDYGVEKTEDLVYYAETYQDNDCRFLVSTCGKKLNDVVESIYIIPILYPPSQLTKLTMIEGEMKIPILELANVYNPSDWVLFGEKATAYAFSFSFNSNTFYVIRLKNNTYYPIQNQYAIFQWLFKNHFAIGLEPDQYIDKAEFEQIKK